MSPGVDYIGKFFASLAKNNKDLICYMGHSSLSFSLSLGVMANRIELPSRNNQYSVTALIFGGSQF